MSVRRRSSILVSGLVAAAVALAGAVGPAAAPALAAAPSVVPSVALRSAVGTYTPTTGVLLNDPLGKAVDRRRLLNHIIGAINSTPVGGRIRIATWNLRSDSAVNALVAAHRRGVSVQVVIDRGNSNVDNPNPAFDKLTTQLAAYKPVRPAGQESFTKTCASSCRGTSGIAHTKMYLFSQAGSARNVVMYGSVNLTDLAAGYQWNDLYTQVNRADAYNLASSVFAQMVLDRPVAQPYVRGVFGNLDLAFLPYSGSGATGDPVMNMLKRVACQGATGGNASHRTILRIGQTAINGDRGVALVTKLKALWNAGCDIKMIYAVMGNQALKIMRSKSGRGPVPFRQVTQDWNKDGVYDRYLHTKFLALGGVYNGKRDAQITWNGSSNWTAVSNVSDDVFAAVTGLGTRRVYTAYTDQWFRWGHAGSAGSSVDGRSANPYAKVQIY